MRAVDPLGFTIELVHHIDHVEPLVQRYDLRRGASINRLDHINIATPDVPVAFDYYTKLGFGVEYGGPDSSFTSLRVGVQFLNLDLTPAAAETKTVSPGFIPATSSSPAYAVRPVMPSTLR